MGRVRTNLIKRASRQLIEKYYARLTLDFDTNKRVVDEVVITPSKKVRNKISGYTTHLMKRIQRGPVRGISLKLQEEERERRLDFVPARSILDVELIEIDDDTDNMLRSLNFPKLAGVKMNPNADISRPTKPITTYRQRGGMRGGFRGRGRGGMGGGGGGGDRGGGGGGGGVGSGEGRPAFQRRVLEVQDAPPVDDNQGAPDDQQFDSVS